MLNILNVAVGIAVATCLVIFVISMLAPRPSTIGVTDGRLAPVPDSPNCVSTHAADELHSIEPLTFQGTSAEAMAKLRDIVSSRTNASIITQEDDYLYAEFRSRVFRYVDDVEFLVDTDARQIHFRSASRIGYSDMGVNRARMEEIRRQFAK